MSRKRSIQVPRTEKQTSKYFQIIPELYAPTDHEISFFIKYAPDKRRSARGSL